MRAVRLAEDLRLPDRQLVPLLEAIREHDRRRALLEAENRRVLVFLRDEVGEPGLGRPRPKAHPPTFRNPVDGALDELAANRRDLRVLEDELIARVRDILSPEDAARYLLFELRFQRELRERLRERTRD